MNRRAFLAPSAVSPLVRLLPACGEPSAAPKKLTADVAVIGGGGGAGGVASAL